MLDLAEDIDASLERLLDVSASGIDDALVPPVTLLSNDLFPMFNSSSGFLLCPMEARDAIVFAAS